MGYLKYVRELWKNPAETMPDLWRQRLIEWRQEPATVRIDRPTRLDRARSLGYKAKGGFVIVRQRTERGGRLREKFHGGRRPKHFRRLKIVGVNYQQVAEQRAQKKYPNCEVLNSYWVASDGNFHWHEVLLVDKEHPQILADPSLSWIARPQHKGRVYRGLTSAGKRTRGLFSKGKGSEKIRPSQRAHDRKAK
ncbi:50S ribosomal protein L15e [Candidatus Woesearchaeota archaeon]|nr:50S ribosomal protein L15e [Candidatus Woesearchaeota archaeon]